MKFIVSSQLLLKNLQIVSSIVAPNNAMPIIQNVLFDVKDNKLSLIATDLETTIIIDIALSDCEGEGQVVVPFKIMLDTLKSMPDVPVVFNVKEDYSIEFSGDESNFSLMGFENTFPEIPVLNDAGSFEIEAKTLSTAISKTLFATGTPDIRPVMSGVFCEVKLENISFVATDAHRLVRYRTSSVKAGIEHSMILPPKPLNTLKSVLSSLDGNVSIHYDEKRVAFVIDSMHVVSKLIEGKYPAYEAVIPQNNNNTLLVERLPLLQRMRTITPFASQTAHQIRIKCSENLLGLKTEDDENNTKGTTSVACHFENLDGIENFEIGFSSKFLVEMLNNLDTNEVVFKLASPTSAGLIYPQNEKETSEDILMLLMPVMLNA